MTGGEDAEKSKDSEVAEDTGSPDRRDPISSRSHQESPLFKYLCDLSPIKPARAVHVAQTYNELTFPPEPRIFASPRSSQRSSSDALKRRAEALEEVKSKSCKVESVGDDLNLSENAPHRTQFCAMKTSEMDQKLPICQLSGTSTSSDSFKSQFANTQEVAKASPLGGPYNSEKVSERYEDHRARLRLYKEQAEASDRGKSSQGFAPEIVGSVPVVINDHVSESQDRGLKRALVSPSHNEDQTQLGQDTTAMAYFLGGDQDSDQRNREDDWSEDSSEGSRLSVHTTSECLKSQKGDMCEGITMNRNILPAGGSSALEEDHNLISEPMTANAEQVVRLPHKVNSSGQHRGFRRRCLDFDASVARGKILDTGKKPSEIRNSGGNQNVNESNNQGCHPPVMPSGIGLHLNSLTSSLSFKRDCHSSRIGNSEGTWASMLAAEPSKSASPKDDQSSDVHTPLDMGSDGLLLTGCERFGPGVTSLLKTSGEKSGESCKRCNCKKSKCLKLYCECFAAGIYCVSSCACQECFNKPEFEETVLNTRQQIESRNPLAFAPKIVQSAKASPKIGEDTMDTPASARHKRGCNCKKSLCLKKYCECYQAGVGCSEGCRCEGCKNMYGRKEGTFLEEGKEGDQVFTSQEEPQADDPIELLNRMSGKSEQFRCTGNKNISPITPSFEHDGLGRSISRLRSGSRKRASDEHCSSTLLQQAGSRPSKSPTWFSNTIDGFQLTANSQGAMELSVDGGTESPLTTMNISRIEHLSPQWEGLADICTLTPLPLAPSRPTPASVTTLDRAGESPRFSAQLIDSTYQGGSSATGHHDGLGRRLRRSPPRFRQPAARSPLHLTQQNTCNENHLIHSRPSSASTHLPVEHSQGGKNSMLAISASGEDDDTPDFLKCPEVTSPLQTTITKSGSPKQKRVTPPRHCDSREQGPSKSVGGSVPSSSPGLRNGRKFTLQALPSLPPVTPPFSCS
ncbi:unnamed protein product [Sphagnum jensenii]|uniref:CRC domain-containing protein n=1 Tax=Sphagnum jensenii TaxID=128206 RepID=A0ABP0X8K0_9BRYO